MYLEKFLYLISDRLGKKPLYWSNINGKYVMVNKVKKEINIFFHSIKERQNFKPISKITKKKYIKSMQLLRNLKFKKY